MEHSGADEESFSPLQFRLRFVLIAIALIALGLGKVIEAENARNHPKPDLRQQYQFTAKMHAGLEESYRLEAERAAKSNPASSDLDRRMSEYHAKMRSKYERAARRPWERLPNDPPSPDPYRW